MSCCSRKKGTVVRRYSFCSGPTDFYIHGGCMWTWSSSRSLVCSQEVLVVLPGYHRDEKARAWASSWCFRFEAPFKVTEERRLRSILHTSNSPQVIPRMKASCSLAGRQLTSSVIYPERASCSLDENTEWLKRRGGVEAYLVEVLVRGKLKDISQLILQTWSPLRAGDHPRHK